MHEDRMNPSALGPHSLTVPGKGTGHENMADVPVCARYLRTGSRPSFTTDVATSVSLRL
jgi:hypothetical protein